MAQARVVIAKKDEKLKELSIYDNAKGLSLDVVMVKEGGTEGGRTAIAFYATHPETGERYFINTSARIMNMISSIATGAMIRFGDDPNSN